MAKGSRQLGLPDGTAGVPTVRLSVAEVADILTQQAELEEKFLLHFASEQLPPELERLRPAQVESGIRLIAALRIASEAYRGFASLPASVQLVIGVIK